MVLPIFITFHLLPKVWILFFGNEEKKQIKKKKPKNVFDERREMAKTLEGYEVRDGRVVKKEGQTFYTGSITLEEEPKKKKNFTKGADPSFL